MVLASWALCNNGASCSRQLHGPSLLTGFRAFSHDARVQELPGRPDRLRWGFSTTPVIKESSNFLR